jgi:hypothetical protein
MFGIIVESTAPRIHYGVDASSLDYPYLRHVLKRLAWVSPELRGPILKSVIEAEQSGLPRVYTKEGTLRVKTMYGVDLMGVEPSYIRKRIEKSREREGHRLTWAEKQATTERLVSKFRAPIPASELPYTGSLSPTGRKAPPGWRQVKGGWQPPAAGKAGGGYYTGQRPPRGGWITTSTGLRVGLVGLEGLGLGYLLYENEEPYLADLGFTFHSTAVEKYNEALALYKSFADRLDSIPDEAARETWGKVVTANYKLLVKAREQLDGGDDTLSRDNSMSVITALQWQQPFFNADLAGRSYEQAAEAARKEGERLTTQVSEEERKAAEAGIVTSAGYSIGKTVKGAVAGAVSGLGTPLTLLLLLAGGAVVYLLASGKLKEAVGAVKSIGGKA